MNYYKFFEFLEQKENRQIPFKIKLKNNPNYQITQDEANGNLNLDNTPITSLPSGLSFKGNLDLYSTPITSLPSDLNVKGYLNLDNTPITSLPSDLKVGGDLYLYDTPLSKSHTEQEIKQIAPGVKGNIYM
jgi:ABC-type uncharacterized transport system YnjBCD ATPase subunit